MVLTFLSVLSIIVFISFFGSDPEIRKDKKRKLVGIGAGVLMTLILASQAGIFAAITPFPQILFALFFYAGTAFFFVFGLVIIVFSLSDQRQIHLPLYWVKKSKNR